MRRPTVLLYEECMREGMQIESASISAEDKVRLLDALSRTGLRAINVGSFVSPRYTPQMANIDEVLKNFTPVEGIHYYYLALNDKGVERASAYVPPLRRQFDMPHLRAELCDTFLRRNNNRRKADLPSTGRSRSSGPRPPVPPRPVSTSARRSAPTSRGRSATRSGCSGSPRPSGTGTRPASR